MENSGSWWSTTAEDGFPAILGGTEHRIAEVSRSYGSGQHTHSMRTPGRERRAIHGRREACTPGMAKGPGAESRPARRAGSPRSILLTATQRRDAMAHVEQHAGDSSRGAADFATTKVLADRGCPHLKVRPPPARWAIVVRRDLMRTLRLERHGARYWCERDGAASRAR